MEYERIMSEAVPKPRDGGKFRHLLASSLMDGVIENIDEKEPVSQYTIITHFGKPVMKITEDWIFRYYIPDAKKWINSDEEDGIAQAFCTHGSRKLLDEVLRNITGSSKDKLLEVFIDCPSPSESVSVACFSMMLEPGFEKLRGFDKLIYSANVPSVGRKRGSRGAKITKTKPSYLQSVKYFGPRNTSSQLRPHLIGSAR